MHETSPQFRGIGLASGFVQNCQISPEAEALVHDGCIWTYEELFVEARKWAKRLRELHAGDTPPVVGILADRGSVEHIGKLAALLAGCTFVPLIPSFPTSDWLE